ncbi:uncharacterized protein LOC125730672, partial [Brienomyrus brachyistius]|uniref:uncharacterized protein LOC125730672 n=1 Tax=Brienomyrus brachyistius TaxID=42636 RepID=UPI0020B1F26B
MTLAEFKNAKVQENRVVISVASHKTSGTYGRAYITLSLREHSWLTQFEDLRPFLAGHSRRPETFFFSSSGQPFYKLGDLVRQTCKGNGMQRSFTISDIRTAVSTCIERNLPPDHRRLVARLMCHTIDTADRFYVADPDIQDVHRSRNFVEQALGMGKHPQAKTGQPCLEDEHEITRPARRSRLIFESSEEEDVPPGPLPLSAMEIEAQQAPAPTVPPQEEHTEEETGELFSDLGLNLETPEKAICQFDLDEEEEEEWESKEEDTDSEINSPLPKVVKKDIKSGVCRRRLSYPESLKNEVVSCFAAYWHEPITTST